MDASDDVTGWMLRLADGSETAARLLWEKYFNRLVRFVRTRFSDLPRRTADEEDFVLSAMDSFCQGLQKGQFRALTNRDDLWKLLVTITARKTRAERRRHRAVKRGQGRVRGESVFGQAGRAADEDRGIGEILGSEPTPELACMLAEQCRTLLDELKDETLRQIALYRLEGYSAAEIAAKLGCVRRTVERKLERIRGKWAHAQSACQS